MKLTYRIFTAVLALLCFSALNAFEFAPQERADYRLKLLDFGVHAEAGVYPNNHGNSSTTGNSALVMERENPNLNLNQAWLWAGREASAETNAFDWGVRFDIAAGTDHSALAASGGDYRDAKGKWHRPWDSSWTRGEGSVPEAGYYGVSIPQLYVQAAWYRWKVTLGHFFGTAGYESLMATDTDFYANSILFNIPPSTLTGIKVERSFGKFDALAGVSNGINTGFKNEFDDYYFMGGLTYNFSDDMSLGYSFIGGSQENSTATKIRSDYTDAFNYFHDLLFQWTAAEKLHLVTELGYNYEHRYDAVEGKQIVRTMGAAQYVMYDITDKLRAALRAEASRYILAEGSVNLYAITANVTFKPCEHIMIRPEARYGWNTYEAYNDDKDKKQLNGGVSLIVKF